MSSRATLLAALVILGILLPLANAQQVIFNTPDNTAFPPGDTFNLQFYVSSPLPNNSSLVLYVGPSSASVSQASNATNSTTPRPTPTASVSLSTNPTANHVPLSTYTFPDNTGGFYCVRYTILNTYTSSSPYSFLFDLANIVYSSSTNQYNTVHRLSEWIFWVDDSLPAQSNVSTNIISTCQPSNTGFAITVTNQGGAQTTTAPAYASIPLGPGWSAGIRLQVNSFLLGACILALLV
ncbi:hypothetical protein BZG36_03037 [Bifiguratus adelaidae]|uniref:Uncharacterized protein n=1 Tax=Bifiguratus adelaidae TaxID=1938954 RepID=A0A261XYZ5_9FUNG|nr:hypothetical protein BZG36_03037 [Bifiguratus adelaidae]